MQYSIMDQQDQLVSGEVYPHYSPLQHGNTYRTIFESETASLGLEQVGYTWSVVSDLNGKIRRGMFNASESVGVSLEHFKSARASYTF